MTNIDTYTLMCELRSRLFNNLEAEEPVSDIMLEELWAESVANEESLKALMYKLDHLIKRYHNMLEARYE